MRGLRAIVIASALAVALAGCASRDGGGRNAFATPSPPPLDAASRLETAGLPPAPDTETETDTPARSRRRGAGADDAAVDALREEVQALKAELGGLRPGIGRLLDIENDIRALLSQLAAISSVTRGAGASSAANGVGGPAQATPLTPLSPLAPQPGEPGSLDGQETNPGLGAASPTPLAPLAVTSGTPSLGDVSTPPVTTPPPAVAAPSPSGEPPPARPPTAPQRAPPTIGGVYLHLASYRDARLAASGWDELTADHGDALAGLSPLIRETDLGDKGVYQRLYAGPTPDRATAARLCARLKARDVYCAVTTLEGRPATVAQAPAPPIAARPPTPADAPPPVATTPARPSPPTLADGGTFAFLGAYRDQATAARGRDLFATTHASIIDQRLLVVVRDDNALNGAAWRLAAGPLQDAAAAEALCAQLRARGAFCTVSDDTPRS